MRRFAGSWQALKDLGRAFARRADFPRFRKKGRSERFRYPDPKQIELDQQGSRIFLPNLGWLRYRNSREALGEVKNVTVSASGEKWFVSVQTEREVEQPVHPSDSKNVKAKRGLNRRIMDQGWHEFRRQLEYKQVWRGGHVVVVPAQDTSRTCPECRHVAAENRRSQERFRCVRCGFEENADLVAAINIRRAGHARIACGEKAQEGRSMKQEPTEATQANAA
jgi:putative transposase